MAALDGAAWMAAHASTKEGVKTWLKGLADNAQIPVADFVGDLAVELKSSSLLSEAEYGKVPTSLQKGRLYNRLADPLAFSHASIVHHFAHRCVRL